MDKRRTEVIYQDCPATPETSGRPKSTKKLSLYQQKLLFNYLSLQSLNICVIRHIYTLSNCLQLHNIIIIKINVKVLVTLPPRFFIFIYYLYYYIITYLRTT